MSVKLGALDAGRPSPPWIYNCYYVSQLSHCIRHGVQTVVRLYTYINLCPMCILRVKPDPRQRSWASLWPVARAVLNLKQAFHMVQ